MRFLADESCDFAVVRALRKAGHDVVAVAEISPRAEDSDVLERALKGKRVLLTEDKDFGQLVYASAASAGGVILFRFPAGTRGSLPKAAVDLVRLKGEDLARLFTVVQPGRVRFGPPPEG
jgi:Domain of unknown function (DUF5615)